MYVRAYERDDVSFCATIFCEAFQNSEFTVFAAPYRNEYPLGYRRLAVRKQHENLLDPGAWGIVCVSDGVDGRGRKDEILGFAWWRRKPAPESKRTDEYMQNNNSLSTKIERLLRIAENQYEDSICRNQCLSPAGDRALSHIMVPHVYEPIERTTRWHLSFLGVGPEHQRKGVGKMLVEWGLELAKEESAAASETPPVPVTLTASGHGKGLYSKLGFKTVDWKDDLYVAWCQAISDASGRDREELQKIYDKVMREDRVTGGGLCMVFESRSFWLRPAHMQTNATGQPIEAVWTDEALQYSSMLR